MAAARPYDHRLGRGGLTKRLGSAAQGYWGAGGSHGRAERHRPNRGAAGRWGQIGFRSDDSEVVLGLGGFENYFRELGELLLEHADDPAGRPLHELPESGEFADEYGLTYGSPEWMDDIAQRYGLNPPSH